MPLPTDTQAWIDKYAPCMEGVERLAEHAGMAAAWDASTNGGMLLYIVRAEGLYTPEVRAVTLEHRSELRAAYAAAKAKLYEGDVRLQDLDADYGVALAALAEGIKAVVPNPFTAP